MKFCRKFYETIKFHYEAQRRQHTARVNGALVTEWQANNAHTLWLKLDIFCVMQRGQNVSLISPTQTNLTGSCSNSRLQRFCCGSDVEM